MAFSFLRTADEFIIAYSTSNYSVAASLFSIGHAVELYLKAANTRMTGDIDRAVNFGHRIKDLWEDCKKSDSLFMPNYELRNNVYNAPFLQQELDKILGKDDAIHFLKNQEFYIVAKHLADLKYLGAPLKSITGGYSIVFCSHNPYWIGFFRELRSYLNYPSSKEVDPIRMAAEGLSRSSDRQFLQDIIS